MATDDSIKGRTKIASLVTFGSLLIIFVMGILSLALNGGNWEPISDAILPVLAAWTGAIIAYYFSQHNTDALNYTVNNLVNKITSEQRLASTQVIEKMIRYDDSMVKIKLKPNENEGEKKLQYIRTEMDKTNSNTDNGKEKNRIPIIDAKDRVKLIIHRSMIDKFITNACFENYERLKGKKPDTCTIDDLKKNDPKIKKLLLREWFLFLLRQTWLRRKFAWRQRKTALMYSLPLTEQKMAS